MAYGGVQHVTHHTVLSYTWRLHPKASISCWLDGDYEPRLGDSTAGLQTYIAMTAWQAYREGSNTSGHKTATLVAQKSRRWLPWHRVVVMLGYGVSTEDLKSHTHMRHLDAHQMPSKTANKSIGSSTTETEAVAHH
jgi:hypothetical protein